MELEELRFPACGLEYELAWALDDARCSVRSMRVGATGFGRLQQRPLSEAPAHFEALAAQPLPSLRGPDGRWRDALLLPACHAAVTSLYELQRC